MSYIYLKLQQYIFRHLTDKIVFFRDRIPGLFYFNTVYQISMAETFKFGNG